MINPKSNLNPDIFEEKVEQIPIRQGFGEGLVEAGKQNENVVALCADLTGSAKVDLFKKEFPERFFEIGIGEQNMASVASGMAAAGKIPFIASYAMFSPGRNWEQIRTNICYNNRKVVIAGSHAGVSVGPDGGTHQAIEDLAITRVMPNMVVISPCDAIEAKKATIAASKTPYPTYIRLAREKTPIITTESTPFEIGMAETVFESKNETVDIGIIATGALLYRALKAAKELEKEGVSVEVLNMHTIKPIDAKAIVRLSERSRAILTVEEHQIIGGLGSAVAETVVKEYPVPMEFVGVKDRFGQSGTPDELIEHYGMDEKAIMMAARSLLARIDKRK